MASALLRLHETSAVVEGGRKVKRVEATRRFVTTVRAGTTGIIVYTLGVTPDRHSGPTLGSVRDCVYRRLADQNSRGFTRRQRLQNLQKPLLEVLAVLAATSARVGILPRARIVGIARPPARRKLRRLFSVKW
jgi:hypothetical protein